MGEPEKQPDAKMSSGRLLALFFGIVILCAVFFGLGAILRRNSGQAGTATKPTTPANPPPALTETKPSAASSQPQATESGAKAESGEPAPVTEKEKPSPSKTTPPAEAKPTPPPAHPTTATSGAGIVVQIAAVTRQEDADALAEALRQKSYPVFIVTNPPTDRLYHVQIGPFHNVQEAESMRDRLAKDGYKAILKK